MRAIEYHEELGHMRESAARYRANGFPGKAAVVDRRAAVYEARIADKLDETGIGWNQPLAFGVPDAQRIYRSPGMRAFYEGNPELLDRRAAVIFRDAPTGLILAEGRA
jgi:hypothetical protein